MKKRVLFFCIVLTGCTTVDVKSVDKVHAVQHVCIEDNPRVDDPDLRPSIESLFHDHGITTEVYTEVPPENCKVTLKYIGVRSWDFAYYLSYAVVRLYKDEERIGYAEYRLRVQGGFALNKWDSVESKMKPVVDQLLVQYRKG